MLPAPDSRRPRRIGGSVSLKDGSSLVVPSLCGRGNGLHPHQRWVHQRRIGRAIPGRSVSSRLQTANGSCDVCSCRYARCVLRPSFRLKASYSLRRGPRISLIQALHSCVLSALSGKTKASDSMLFISFFLDPLAL